MAAASAGSIQTGFLSGAIVPSTSQLQKHHSGKYCDRKCKNLFNMANNTKKKFFLSQCRTTTSKWFQFGWINFHCTTIEFDWNPTITATTSFIHNAVITTTTAGATNASCSIYSSNECRKLFKCDQWSERQW